MSWREHDEDGEDPMTRDYGTTLERLVGWLLSYPARFMVVMLIFVMFLTFACGV